MICSFWLVSCLAKAGEVERAEELFDAARRLRQRPRPARRGDRHRDGEQLGNFPQAFSHIGLITAAYEIDKARGVAG